MSAPNQGGSGLAPVVPLFGARPASRDRAEPSWAPPFGVEPEEGNGDPAEGTVDDQIDGSRSGDGDAAGALERDTAARSLRKRLGTRQLSLREARTVVAAHDLSPDVVEDVVADFVRLGYLDDERLAEQIVHIGVDRKGQGRGVIRRTLAERGIATDIADAALADMADDESERALEFARKKASSMRGLGRDSALRRLHGQLARRGFSGPVAMTAARTALDEL